MATTDSTPVTARPTQVLDPLASDIDGAVVVARQAPPERELRLVARPPRRPWPRGWQIGLAIAGWPLWWALGVTQFVFPVLAAPLAYELYQRGRVRVPPGFWIWALFLLWVTVSVVTLDVTAEGTLPPAGSGRYLAFGVRLLNYAAVTVMMLYVGNADERELPRRRVIGWCASLGLATIALGVLAVLFPTFRFQTPLARVFPGLLAGDRGEAVLAQVQPLLGASAPRPAAPFAFTNAWGNNISLLLVFLVLSWAVLGGPRRKILVWPALAVAIIPIVYSLNRGMWIGLLLSLVLVAARFALRGRVGMLAALAAVLAVASLVFAVSPLVSLVSERVEAGHSNEVRGSLARDAVSSAADSPIIGYGSTRATVGSDASITIGRTQDCPKCGNFDIGSTGQLWLILIAQGVVGAALYLGFFLRTLWEYGTDHSALGIAGTLVVALELFYAFFYTALVMPLAVTFIAVGLLWRNAQMRPPR